MPTWHLPQVLATLAWLMGRIAVHAAFDVVDAMAVVAGRRDDQAHFQKRGAVDAVHVLVRSVREIRSDIPS
jgi:hypothetical protein